MTWSRIQLMEETPEEKRSLERSREIEGAASLSFNNKKDIKKGFCTSN